jgi:hypothetical protein
MKINIEVRDENQTLICVLNKRLVEKQKLKHKDVAMIKKLHVEKYKVLQEMKTEEDRERLQHLAELITEIEFELQDAWKFSNDINYHRFWKLPKCKCPQMDNEDAYPTGYYTKISICPIHGW